jgi:hypothetical protein
MRHRIINCEQNTPEWFDERRALVTSSIADVIFMQGRTKGSESVTKKKARVKLALEDITGRSLDGDGYRSADMEYGSKREPDARLAYEAQTGVLLETVGFIRCEDLAIGTSPDGLIRDGERIEGGVELKCPTSPVHLDYLRGGVIPADYLPQMRHHLLVTGADWWDFVSFDDRMPDDLQLFIRRLWAKDAELPAYELALRGFLGEIQQEIASINSLRQQVAA